MATAPVPPKPHKQHQEANTKSLLLSPSSSSSSSSSSSPTCKSPTAFLLLFFTSFTFAVLFPSSSSVSKPPHQPPNKALTRRRPTVILISSDGFRYGYHLKARTPNLHRLIANGTEAVPGLIPVFPTLTFPNHYSIVTGLYPSSHGIINNFFIDPATGDAFSKLRHEPRWWLGEPLWETVARHGLPAAAYFWAGSEVKKGSWTCPPKFCPKYDSSVPFDDRVDDVLSYFDLPADEIPRFIALYFEQPDASGHLFGPDDAEITNAVAGIDRVIGRLIAGLEKRGIFEDVTLILVGDHGMVGTCQQKLIFLEDLSPWIEIPRSWVHSYGPLLAIRPPANVAASEIVSKMNQGLSSGRVNNARHLTVYLKEDLPERLHYSESQRIPAIIGLVGEGYKVKQRRLEGQECGGSHGYDNALFSMRTVFVALGPRFEKGRKVPAFENVEIYNMVTAILELKGAPNNGSELFPDSVLLPRE